MLDGGSVLWPRMMTVPAADELTGWRKTLQILIVITRDPEFGSGGLFTTSLPAEMRTNCGQTEAGAPSENNKDVKVFILT